MKSSVLFFVVTGVALSNISIADDNLAGKSVPWSRVVRSQGTVRAASFLFGHLNPVDGEREIEGSRGVNLVIEGDAAKALIASLSQTVQTTGIAEHLWWHGKNISCSKVTKMDAAVLTQFYYFCELHVLTDGSIEYLNRPEPRGGGSVGNRPVQ